MAEYVVSSALETFTILLARQPEMGCGPMGHQILDIKAKLENLLPFLPDADACDQSSLKIWQVLAIIRELAYKAVDVVETFYLRLNATRLSGIERALDPISSRATTREAKQIAAEISEMTTCLQRLGVRTLSEGDHTYKRQEKVRENFFNFGEFQPVGLDSHVQHLSNLLLEGDNHGRIICIFGRGGLGKTTLANLVYRDIRIKDHFDCFAWVVLSQRYDIDYVLESIKIQLASSITVQGMEFHHTNRSLIVLDDIWDAGIFVDLRLQGIAAKSKIIVTTRNGDIGKRIQSIYETPFQDLALMGRREKTAISKLIDTTREGDVAKHDVRLDLYELQCLDCESSWILFHSIAISKRDEAEIKDKMINLGKKIIICCEGTPLIISLLAGLLSTKHTLQEWEAVMEMMMSNRGVESNYYYKLLDLFYDDLSYYLKPCFLYFSQFPNGLEISVKKLIQMWVADGVISTMTHERDGQKETMEDTAYHFLTELAERFVVLVGKRGSTGKIKICKMHDIMLDLAKWKAKQENFFDTAEAPRFSMGNVTYFKNHDISREELLEMLNPCARSLIYDLPRPKSLAYYLPISKHEHDTTKLEVKRFKFLRVLCVENFRSTRSVLTKEIGDLALLRFLSFKNSDISELSPSIFCLRFLQSLDARTSTSDLTIPNMLWRTESLRHLYMHHAYSLKKGGKLKLGHLSKLQTLVNINDMHLDLEDVIQLSSLRKLVIVITDTSRGFVAREFGEVSKFKNNTLSRLQSLGILNMTSTNAEIRLGILHGA